MNQDSEENKRKQEQEQEIRQEVFRERQFGIADILAQQGGGFLKGESPVPKFKQLKAEMQVFVSKHLQDSTGALQSVLHNLIEDNDEGVNKYEDNPLMALAEMIDNFLSNPSIFYEFVRQVDLKWGQMYQERPFFQKPGQLPHPDDEYSHESVKEQLLKLQSEIKENLKRQ